jgi:hypothetical protein
LEPGYENCSCEFQHRTQSYVRILQNDIRDDGGRIAISPDRFDKLITALRTAVDNDGTLDKESTSYNDIFDAFRLALKFYHFEEKDRY